MSCIDTTDANACATFQTIQKTHCPDGLCSKVIVEHTTNEEGVGRINHVFNTIHEAMDLGTTLLTDTEDAILSVRSLLLKLRALYWVGGQISRQLARSTAFPPAARSDARRRA